ncbi:hypothetical protein [Saccharopolyspora sp. NPDC002686]
MTLGNGRAWGADFPVMREGIPGLRVHLPAVVVCVVLGAALALLVVVSFVVPGPQGVAELTPADGIVTAVTPTELSAAVGSMFSGR